MFRLDPAQFVAQDSGISQAAPLAQSTTGQSFARAMSGLDAIARNEQQARDRSNASAVTRDFSEFQVVDHQALMDLRAGGNPDTMVDDYLKGVDERLQPYLDNVADEDAKQMMRDRAATYRASQATGLINHVAKERVAIQKQAVGTAINNYSRIAYSDPSQINTLLRQLDGDVAASNALGLSDSDDVARQGREAIATAAFNGMSAGDKGALFDAPAGGFDAAIETVLEHEGGYSDSDGGTGVPVNFGINQAANPDIDVKSLTQDGAKQIYKDRYWDRFGMDSVPESTQTIVFDGVVNHRQDFGRQLVEAAKGGATGQELLDMRQREYERLVTENPAKYENNLNGWLARLDNLETKATSGFSAPAWMQYVPLAEIERARAEYTNNQMLYASPVERRALLVNNPRIAPALAKTAATVDRALAEDPAGYVAQAPDLQEIAPEDAIAASMGKQREMGVPEHRVRAIPKSVADQLETVMKSENATAQKVLEYIDSARGQYGEVWDRAVGDMRDFGVSGPVAMLAGMENGARRSELAEAILLGDRLKDSVPSSIKPADISKEIEGAIEDYREAVSVLPQGTRVVADVHDAMSMLTQRYLAKGMNLGDAVDEARAGLLDVEIRDTLVLPKGTDSAAVAVMADKVKARLVETDILPPNGVLGDVARESLYRQSSIQNAVPVVTGDRVVFIGPDGLPLLDATKAERDEQGRVTNAESAAISFPIADALDMVDAPQAMAAPDSLGNLLYVMHSQAGVDVSKYFAPQSSVDGLQYWGRFPRVGNTFITQSSYAAMSDAQKAAAKEILQNNVEYVQKVRSRLPESSRAAYDQFITKSQNAWLDRDNTRALIDEYSEAVRGQRLTDAQAKKLRELRAKSKEDLFGVGLQYLEMPEWVQ